jgi:hypothetical protein
MHEEDELIAVSPRHSVRLAAEYADLLTRAPSRDFLVRTIARREAKGLPLMSADIVIAGAATREAFPRARQYPLHFRKTYYPGRLHGDPKDEFDRQTEASALIGIPEPIGHEPDTFRACLLPGTPYSRLSPLDVAPEESQLRHARDLDLAAAAGLFRLIESAFASLVALHDGGLAHGDAELHNFIVCPSPLETLLIDFEAALRKDATTDETWEKIVAKDLDPVLREAVLLQCCLGPQSGRLAETARGRIDNLFQSPEPVRREIERSATRPA